jgi:MarR family transcriptional regulator, lower aerobic nicotinate degradation pathway regulator
MIWAKFWDVDESAYHPPAKLQQMPSWLLSRAAMGGDRLVTATLAESGLRKHHFTALLALAEAPGLSQAGLGRRLGLDVSDVHAVVGVLEERGYVGRTRDRGDRRRNVLHLTAAGKRELARLERRVLAAQDKLLAPLSDSARRQLVAALEILVVR